MNKRLKQILVVITLILMVGLCNGDPGGPLDYVDKLQCDNTLVIICGDTEHTVMVGVKDLSEEIEGNTRYFKFWDCAMGELLQSSCDADCTLEMRETQN